MADDFDSVLSEQIAAIPDADLLDDLKQLIRDAESERPRSQQRIPGPSEAGHPCMRRLAYGINRARQPRSEAQGQNRYSDPLAAIMGTAMHAWLEEAARAANKRLGRTRWVPEQRVVVRSAVTYEDQKYALTSGEPYKERHVIREELAGTCDLYDFDTKGVLDWKVPGATRLAHYVKHGPSEVYRGQAHLYGRGYINLGFDVETVGIVFIPRTGNMRGMHLWREPYNPELVEEILSRLDDVEDRMKMYKVHEDPSGFLRLPIVPGDDCRFCPWFSPQPETAYECDGKLEK